MTPEERAFAHVDDYRHHVEEVDGVLMCGDCPEEFHD